MARYSKEISRETFEQIENYLLNRMDEATRSQFEQAMAANEELADEVELQQRLFAAVEAGSFTVADQNTSLQQSRNYSFWYAAAAILLVIAGFSIWFVQRNAASSSAGLYAAYFHPDAGLPVEMGAADSTRYLFYDGMISYKEGNYTEALSKWKKIEGAEKRTDTLRYYIAIANLNLGNANESIKGLKPLISNPKGSFYEPASWYLALAYLKKDNQKAAYALLKKIPKYPEALALLNKLHE